MKNVTATTDSGIPARSITSMQNAKETHSSLLKIGIAAVLALLLVFSGVAAAGTADAADVYDEAALREAVTQPDFNVRLCADIKLTDFYKTGRDNSLVIPPAVTKGTIDLNGHTLLYAGKDSRDRGDNNGAVIIIKSGELTVNDSSSEKTGKITGGRGTHTLMTYGQNYLFGGGVYVADGAHFILNGGSISDNRIDNSGMIDAAGAGVYADEYGEVTMNGGSISNNYASAHNGYGAGVHIRRGSFTMTGGTISGNIASSSNSVGGGVYIWGNVKFIMTGGVISGNSANRGGGVYVNSGATFYVGKSVSIMDNSKDDVALIDGHFRTIPKGMLHLTEDLNGYVLVAPEDRYRGPSFGTASSGLSPQTERGIINEKDWKYATVVDEDRKLVWGDNPSSLTLLTLDWGDGDKIGHVVIPQGGRWIHITPISKPGYTFTGWYLQEQSGTAPLIDVNGYLAKGVSSYTDGNGNWIYTGETLTLVAGWNHDGTTLTLDGNGGTPISQPVKVTYDSTTVVYSKPSREDAKPYIFCGWFLEREEGKTLLIDVNGNLEKNVTVGDKRYTDAAGRWTYSEPTLTLYAGWYANGTMLTLNGYLGEPAAQTVAVELGATKVSGINLSVIDGYACTGWYKLITNVPIKFINRDGTLEKNVTDGVTQYTNENGEWIYYQTTLPLTAEWITNVTYCYSNETVVKDGKKNYYLGESFDIPNATAFGDSFFGWRVGSPIGPFIFFCQGTDYQYLTPSPYYDNNYNWTAKEETLKLYAAIWGENGVSNGGNAVPTSLLTVTYDKNGAESGRVPIGTEWYAPGDAVTVRGNTGALERYGYTFSGWNTAAGGTGQHYNAGDIFTINDNTTLYAQWTANQYTVTFETGDDESPVNPITAYHGTTISKPNPDPICAGYTFSGWYKITSSIEEWDFTNDKVTEDITLYANWTVNTSAVTASSEGTAEFGGDNVTAVMSDGISKVISIRLDNASNVNETVTFIADNTSVGEPPAQEGKKRIVISVFNIDAKMKDDELPASFNITVTLVNSNDADKVVFWHYNSTRGEWDTHPLKSTIVSGRGTNKVTYKVDIDSFSPFGITIESEIPQPQPSSSSSSSRDYGASVWLQPTAEPTPMPAAAEEPTPAQPAASPVNQPPAQTSTPAPIAGIIAGLGAAGLVFGLRRR